MTNTAIRSARETTTMLAKETTTMLAREATTMLSQTRTLRYSTSAVPPINTVTSKALIFFNLKLNDRRVK